jgi:uncharacterized protein
MVHRPETIGAVIWPYQCLGWTARVRLDRIRAHYACIERLGGPIDFPVDGRLSLLSLADIREGLHVVVDQPVWFMREGQLSINLFLGETRLYTVAFSLFPSVGGIAAFVGSIQGRDIQEALDEYRKLTKTAYGMRPRDLLIELFRMFCATIGVTQIFAVSDEHRHHRDRYFGDIATTKISANYNDIWEDRGGERIDAMQYRLALEGKQRDLATVQANKRSMYRKRYEMLGQLKQQMRDEYARLSASSRN